MLVYQRVTIIWVWYGYITNGQTFVFCGHLGPHRFRVLDGWNTTIFVVFQDSQYSITRRNSQVKWFWKEDPENPEIAASKLFFVFLEVGTWRLHFFWWNHGDKPAKIWNSQVWEPPMISPNKLMEVVEPDVAGMYPSLIVAHNFSFDTCLGHSRPSGLARLWHPGIAMFDALTIFDHLIMWHAATTSTHTHTR